MRALVSRGLAKLERRADHTQWSSLERVPWSSYHAWPSSWVTSKSPGEDGPRLQGTANSKASRWLAGYLEMSDQAKRDAKTGVSRPTRLDVPRFRGFWKPEAPKLRAMGMSGMEGHRLLSCTLQGVETEIGRLIPCTLSGMSSEMILDVVKWTAERDELLSLDLSRQDQLCDGQTGRRIVKLLASMCSGGRTPEDAALHREWAEKNACALWERGTFRAGEGVPEERIHKGTPSGVRFGAALNSIFSAALLLGCAEEAGVDVEGMLVQGDDLLTRVACV